MAERRAMRSRPSGRHERARPVGTKRRRLLSRSPRLDAAELADAAVLGDLALVLALVGWFLPFGGVLFLAATVPYAVLVSRRRFRAAAVAAITTGVLAFVVGGVPLVLNLAGVASIGNAVGIAYRRGHGYPGTIMTALAVCWVPAAIVTDLAFLVFSETRKLTLEQVEVAFRGPLKTLSRLGYEDAAANIHDVVQWCLDHWWLTIPIGEFVLAIVAALVCRQVALPALRRVDATFTRPVAAARRDVDAASLAVAPLPVRLSGVGFRYPGAPVDALSDVDLAIDPGTFVAIVGDNGSGKSTLAAILSGNLPTRGHVTRPGAVGLGRRGGTGQVFQRPESQVLGARVSDDVRWGLGRDEIDEDTVAGTLDRVGLAGFAERDTSTLSGGELQRLALASAIVRHPALLISDESTAMLDPDGRDLVLDVLVTLRDAGTTIVHVTHEPEEAARADMVVVLDGGRVREVGTPAEVFASRGDRA
jgi:energy-coupling factor transport system ATP-binding protein